VWEATGGLAAEDAPVQARAPVCVYVCVCVCVNTAGKHRLALQVDAMGICVGLARTIHL